MVAIKGELRDIPGLAETMAAWPTPKSLTADDPTPILRSEPDAGWDPKTLEHFDRRTLKWADRSIGPHHDYAKLQQDVLDFEYTYFTR